MMEYETKDRWLVEDLKKDREEYQEKIKKRITPVKGEPIMILALPMTGHCNGCPAASVETHNYGCQTFCMATKERRPVGGFYKDDTPDWCPARPLPERKDEMDYLATGWNLCLDMIIEEVTE